LTITVKDAVGYPASNENVTVEIVYDDAHKADSNTEKARRYGTVTSPAVEVAGSPGVYRATYTAGRVPRVVTVRAYAAKGTAREAYADANINNTVVDQVAPLITIKEPVDNVYPAGTPITITAEIDDANMIRKATLRYRVGGMSEWSASVVESETGIQNRVNPTIIWPTHGATAKDREAIEPTMASLVYYIEAVDMHGNEALSGSPDNPHSLYVSGTITAKRSIGDTGEVYLTPPLTSDDKFKQPDGTPLSPYWYMITLPVDVDNPQLDDVFSGPWSAYVYEDGSWKSGSQYLFPGRGVIIAANTTEDLSLSVNGTSQNITENLAIPLQPGWNLVGNPFSFGRYWDDNTISVRKDGQECPITEAESLVYHTIYWTNREGPPNDIGGGSYDPASANPLVPNQAWELDDLASTQFPAALGPFSGFFVMAFDECELLISPTSHGPDDVLPPTPASPIISSKPVTVLDIKPPQLPFDSAIAKEKPEVTTVYQNYPNPFNPETWVPYQLSEDADVIIRIYDVKGHLVRALDLGHKSAGFYVAKEKAAYWNGRNDTGERISSGLYFYQLQAGKFRSSVTRMVILK
jgi:hypothetical protein